MSIEQSSWHHLNLWHQEFEYGMSLDELNLPLVLFDGVVKNKELLTENKKTVKLMNTKWDLMQFWVHNYLPEQWAKNELNRISNDWVYSKTKGYVLFSHYPIAVKNMDDFFEFLAHDAYWNELKKFPKEYNIDTNKVSINWVEGYLPSRVVFSMDDLSISWEIFLEQDGRWILFKNINEPSRLRFDKDKHYLKIVEYTNQVGLLERSINHGPCLLHFNENGLERVLFNSIESALEDLVKMEDLCKAWGINEGFEFTDLLSILSERLSFENTQGILNRAGLCRDTLLALRLANPDNESFARKIIYERNNVMVGGDYVLQEANRMAKSLSNNELIALSNHYLKINEVLSQAKKMQQVVNRADLVSKDLPSAL